MVKRSLLSGGLRTYMSGVLVFFFFTLSDIRSEGYIAVIKKYDFDFFY